MELLASYFKAVSDALWAAHNGEPVQRELDILAPMQLELLAEHAGLASLNQVNLEKARAIYVERAQELRDKQHWLITYMGGGEELVVSWTDLANRLKLSEATIRVNLSKGGGKRFNTRLTNPKTDEPDIATVWRINDHNAPKPVIKRGRPRTRPLTESEYLQSRNA